MPSSERKAKASVIIATGVILPADATIHSIGTPAEAVAV